MTHLEALEQRLYDENVAVIDYDFCDVPLKGLYVDNKIFLSPLKNTIEKRCILAEEYCHHCYNYGNILLDKKQEALARRMSYEMLVPLRSLRAAEKAGCYTAWEVAEYLEVTEEVLVSALKYYKCKGPI